VFYIESIELKWYPRMIIGMDHSRRVGMVKRVLMKICIVIWIIGYHYAINSRNLGGEIGRSFPGASLVYACLSDVPLYISKFFSVSGAMMRNRNRLWD
jgi:hypothetical protein